MGNVFTKINFKSDLWAILLILIVSIFGYLSLLQRGFFSMHDDIQILRVFEMQSCFKDLQIPCRWVPDMGAQYGHPVFNYHPVLPYYFGMIFRLFKIGFIDTIKILFFIWLFLPSVFAYFS